MKKIFKMLVMTAVMVLAFAGSSYASATFSSAWSQDAAGTWHAKDSNGNYMKDVWFCDDAVSANGKNVWYLLDPNGNMVSAGLVQDGTGNFYSLETNHDGYYGMLRYKSGYYNCNGTSVYLELEQAHSGGFGSVKNADGLEKLKTIYGVTSISNINNSNIVYSSSYVKSASKVEAPSGGGGGGGGGSSSGGGGGSSSRGSSGKSSSGGGNSKSSQKSEKTFKAVAVKDKEDMYGLTFYYDNDSHGEDGTDVILYDDLVTTADEDSDWDYNDIRSSVKSVVFDSTVATYSELESTAYMLAYMDQAASITGAEYLDTSAVTNMCRTFCGFGENVEKLSSVPNVSKWDTSKVTDMKAMFSGYGWRSVSISKVPDVSGWNVANVKNLSSIFSGYGYLSSKLTAVPNVSNWKTSNVTNMYAAFADYGYNSKNLATVPDVSKWDTSKVTDMSSVFARYAFESTKLNAAPNVKAWKTAVATTMSELFDGYGYTSEELEFKIDLSGWNVADLEAYDMMFNASGQAAKTWSVTIPEKTDDLDNDESHWYVSDDKYIEPAEKREFSIKK